MSFWKSALTTCAPAVGPLLASSRSRNSRKSLKGSSGINLSPYPDCHFGTGYGLKCVMSMRFLDLESSYFVDSESRDFVDAESPRFLDGESTEFLYWC